MFDISTRLLSEQDEISGLETIGWENHSWKYLSLIGDERVNNLQRTKVYVFSDSVLCLGKMNQNPTSEKIDSVPSNVQSSRQEALLYVFEDNEAVIKMIIKGRSPTMRHVSRTHRVALDWLLDRVTLDSKIQIKYIDTKNQLTDILTKGSFTRDEWNHLLCLFYISHFSPTVCSDVMAKRSQKDSGEERVTAKSRPMMNLIARTPSFVSSSTSVSLVKKYYGYQHPWK